MDGNDDFWLKEFDRPQTIRWTHSVVVPDRDESQIELLFANQLHIPEQTGILRHIDLFTICSCQEEATGIAAIRPIRQGRAVDGERQLEIAKGIVIPAAQMLTVRLFHALRR